MTSIEYIETMIRSCERIYMDTAALMDTEGLERFISNSESILKANERKIIIPKSVRSELARHLGSENHVKAALAMRAVELISQHLDLFQVENEPVTEEEIAEAFADAHILSELTLTKSACSQLLITNDKKLSADAFFLNRQQSSRGYQIRVCYINRSGELRKCECVGSSMQRVNPDKVNMLRNNRTEPENRTEAEQNADKKEQIPSHQGQRLKKARAFNIIIGSLMFCGGTYFGWAIASNRNAA